MNKYTFRTWHATVRLVLTVLVVVVALYGWHVNRGGVVHIVGNGLILLTCIWNFLITGYEMFNP